MTTDEQSEQERYVRERWVLYFAKLDDQWIPHKFHIRIAIPSMPSSSSTPGISVVRDKESDAWQAAYDFTTQREREIAEVEEEIAQIKQAMDYWAWKHDLEIWSRILARLEAIKAELLRGMVKR